jgi:hypothetical protein
MAREIAAIRREHGGVQAGVCRKGSNMSKSVITRLFVGGIIAFVAGVFIIVIAGLIALASGALIFQGGDLTGWRPTPQLWTVAIIGLLGVLAILGGGLAGLVAWIGALINTAQLQDKTWFVLLLVLGLLSFGFVAMLAYVIGGPDSTKLASSSNQQPQHVYS